ncbi:MAG: hypothetical protein AAF934_00590 [Bacteroidota bacterium]
MMKKEVLKTKKDTFIARTITLALSGKRKCITLTDYFLGVPFSASGGYGRAFGSRFPAPNLSGAGRAPTKPQSLTRTMKHLSMPENAIHTIKPIKSK